VNCLKWPCPDRKMFNQWLGMVWQTDEGRRQTQMEKFQTEKKLTVFNSEIDFCQPMRTNLAVITKSDNITPGQLDRQPTITIKKPDRQKNRQTRNISDRRIAKGRRNTNHTSTPTKTNTVAFNYSTASFSPIRKKRTRSSYSWQPSFEARLTLTIVKYDCYIFCFPFY